MERTRAAALTTIVPASSAGAEEALGALRAVHAEMQRARRETGAYPEELVNRQAEVEERVRRAAWASAPGDVGKGEVRPSVPALRDLLVAQVLVEYDVLDGRVVAGVLERRRTRLVRLGPVDEVRRDVEALVMLLRAMAHGGTGGRWARCALPRRTRWLDSP
ncbi:MAG TPA: hypothetical protein VK908_15295 [Jiangellales bacterium]|nr:hypothetical protein [Jiangellales bacterium]